MAGTGLPSVKVVCRSEKQAFRPERILVPFHIEFNVPAKNIKDLMVRVSVDAEVKAGTLIAFIMPYLHKVAMKNTIPISHVNSVA
jgi:uncharacterized lipoprotein YbaY